MQLGGFPGRVVAQGRSVWVIGLRHVARYDARTRRKIGEPIRLNVAPTDIAVGAGLVWVTTGSSVVRIKPGR